MADIDVEIDTVLREKAIHVVDEFVRSHDTPVSRSQIAGLLQVASNEPSLLSRFAGSQKDRAKKRADGLREGDRKEEKMQAEVAYWALVQELSEGKGAKCPWSLLQAREAALQARPDLHLEKLPPGAKLSSEDRKRRDEKQAVLKTWERQWNREHYLGFFRHFCAHYLFLMSAEKH